MTLTKRKLLAVLSLELLLYAFVYLPALVLVLLASVLQADPDRLEKARILALTAGPPCFVISTNLLMLRAAFRRRRDQYGRSLFRFGLSLMALQFGLALVASLDVVLTVAVGGIAASGLIAAWLMEPEKEVA